MSLFNRTLTLNDLTCEAIKSTAINNVSNDIVFELKQFGIDNTVSIPIINDAISNAKFITNLSAITEKLTLKLIHQVYVNDSSTVIKFHTTWWDMFKDTYFPKWLKKYCPIKFTEHVIPVKNLLINQEAEQLHLVKRIFNNVVL